MNKAEFQTYHEREAARLRRLIASATTPALKAWLIEQAQEHERLADGLTVVRHSGGPPNEIALAVPAAGGRPWRDRQQH